MNAPCPTSMPLSTEIDSAELRRCVGRFATGVVVVTYPTPDGPRGMTINSFTSVSLDPPLILASVARKARSHDLLIGSQFTVNVLNARQMHLAQHFAGGQTDIEIEWDLDPLPSLAGSLARIYCEPWDRHDGGDHSLFLGRVVGLDERDGNALAYHESRFTRVATPTPGLPVAEPSAREQELWA